MAAAVGDLEIGLSLICLDSSLVCLDSFLVCLQQPLPSIFNSTQVYAFSKSAFFITNHKHSLALLPSACSVSLTFTQRLQFRRHGCHTRPDGLSSSRECSHAHDGGNTGTRSRTDGRHVWPDLPAQAQWKTDDSDLFGCHTGRTD